MDFKTIYAVLALALWPSSLLAQGNHDCYSYKLTAGMCNPPECGTLELEISKGVSPTQEQQQMIDDALAKIAAWESACSPPGVPVQFVAGQSTRPVSEILTQYKNNICIESKANTGEDATTSLEAGFFPDSSGLGFHVISGFGTNLNPALFGPNDLGVDPCIQLALVLVHGAYHLENPTKWDDDLNAAERAAHDFSMGWYCAIADCESDASVKANICKYWSKLSGRLLGDPYCFPPYDCPHCPPTIAGVAWGVHP